MGRMVNIFFHPDVESLVKLAKRDHLFISDDEVRKEAEEVLGAFYREYESRFEDIGDPREFGVRPEELEKIRSGIL